MEDFNKLIRFEGDELSPESEVTFEQALTEISQIVEQMLMENPDLLFSYLYRLDVDEFKIKNALSPYSTEVPKLGLARLIIERQQQRIRTRKEYSRNNNS